MTRRQEDVSDAKVSVDEHSKRKNRVIEIILEMLRKGEQGLRRLLLATRRLQQPLVADQQIKKGK